MPWNGFGVFTRLYNWQQDALNNIRIRADRMDGEFDNYQDGLENCITRDGQNSPLTPLPMGGFNHTGVAPAANRDEYLQVAQYQDGQFAIYNTTTGSGAAYTLTITPAPVMYTPGMAFRFKAHVSSSAAATINISGLGPKLIVLNGSAVGAGDIVVNRVYIIIYNGTDFELFTSSSGGGGGGGGTVTSVDITPPAEGITATGGPITSAGSIALALSDDLEAVESINTTGLAARTAGNTWLTRTIQAVLPLQVSNGDGVAGDPTISLVGSVAPPFWTGNTRTGRRYYPAHCVQVLGTANSVASTLYAFKIQYPARTWAGIGFEIVSPTAGTARIGIYTDVDGYPGTLVYQSSDISTNSAGFKNSLSSLALTDQPYWIAINSSIASNFRRVGFSNTEEFVGTQGFDSASNSLYKGFSTAFAYGALPGSFPGGASLVAVGAGVPINAGYLIS